MLGISYQYYRKSFFDRSYGQLRLFFLNGSQWVEQYGMENSHRGDITLLCFADNDNQLLFHKEGEHCIKSLIVCQNKLFGFITYQSSTIQIFINLTCYPYIKIVSKDQKFILIYDYQKYSLLDVNQKTITFTINGDEQYHKAIMRFFDNNYLVFTQRRGKKMFQYQHQESGKNPYPCKYIKTSYSYDTKIQNLISKSLGFYHQNEFDSCTIVLLNMTNLKFIRKIKLLAKGLQNFAGINFQFRGISQKYLLHTFKSNNQIRLCVIDPFNLNIMQPDLNSDQSGQEMNSLEHVFFGNQIFAVENRKLKQTEFWLIK